MDSALAILVDYGVLGLWVVFSILRERHLLRRLDDMNAAFNVERGRWNRERYRWLTILGRKLSDRTLHDLTDSPD